MQDHTRAEIDAFWAQCFRCAPEELTAPGVRVVASGGDLADYHGGYAMRRAEGCILAVPAEWVARATEAVRGLAPDQLFTPLALAGVFGDAVERVIGPASRGYADESDFQPTEMRGARLLTDSPADRAALAGLRAACTEQDWEHSGIEPEREPILGVFGGVLLLAVASYRRQAPRMLHICVLTHPGFRGFGFARAAVSALCQHGLAEEGILQYQTLLSNTPSLNIARALGFQEYARTIAVRLR
jgi:hypothetical protein